MKRLVLAHATTLRLVALAALLLGLSVAWLDLGSPRTAAAQGGPGIGSLAFSRTKTDDNRPIQPSNGFIPPVSEIWVTFEHFNIQPGSNVSRIVRFGDNDQQWGDLACCSSQNGRFAFPIRAAAGSALFEGGWDVFIYVNGGEAARGGFAVVSSAGSDTSGGATGNSNGNSNGNGNDNS